MQSGMTGEPPFDRVSKRCVHRHNNVQARNLDCWSEGCRQASLRLQIERAL